MRKVTLDAETVAKLLTGVTGQREVYGPDGRFFGYLTPVITVPDTPHIVIDPARHRDTTTDPDPK